MDSCDFRPFDYFQTRQLETWWQEQLQKATIARLSAPAPASLHLQPVATRLRGAAAVEPPTGAQEVCLTAAHDPFIGNDLVPYPCYLRDPATGYERAVRREELPAGQEYRVPLYWEASSQLRERELAEALAAAGAAAQLRVASRL